MKKCFVGIVLLCIGISANAQFASSKIVRTNISPLCLSVTSSGTTPKLPGQRMKDTGTALIFGGIAVEAAGIIVLSSVKGLSLGFGDISYQSSDPNNDQLPTQALIGIVGVVGGIGMMVPGIIFTSKGTKRYNRYLQEQKQLGINLKGNGLSLTLKF